MATYRQLLVRFLSPTEIVDPFFSCSLRKQPNLTGLIMLWCRSWPFGTTCSFRRTYRSIFCNSSLPIYCLLWTYSSLFVKFKCFWSFEFQWSLEWPPISTQWSTIFLCISCSGSSLSKLGASFTALFHNKQSCCWCWSADGCIRCPKICY